MDEEGRRGIGRIQGSGDETVHDSLPGVRDGGTAGAGSEHACGGDGNKDVRDCVFHIFYKIVKFAEKTVYLLARQHVTHSDMKTLKHIVAAVAALSILTSCSVLKGLTSSAASAGSNTGSAIAAIYNIFKSTGGIDLNNITTLVNLGKILSGAKTLTDATEAFTSDFTSGLISGSSNLVNSANVASVLSGLKSLANINTSAITKATSAYSANGTAPALTNSTEGVSATVSALTKLMKAL